MVTLRKIVSLLTIPSVGLSQSPCIKGIPIIGDLVTPQCIDFSGRRNLNLILAGVGATALLKPKRLLATVYNVQGKLENLLTSDPIQNAIQGVTPQAVCNAKVTFQLGPVTFSTCTDPNGEYSLMHDTPVKFRETDTIPYDFALSSPIVNPSGGYTAFALQSKFKDLETKVFNINGQEVKNAAVIQRSGFGDGKYRINVDLRDPSIANGTYFVSVVSPIGSLTQKITKISGRINYSGNSSYTEMQWQVLKKASGLEDEVIITIEHPDYVTRKFQALLNPVGTTIINQKLIPKSYDMTFFDEICRKEGATQRWLKPGESGLNGEVGVKPTWHLLTKTYDLSEEVSSERIALVKEIITKDLNQWTQNAFGWTEADIKIYNEKSEFPPLLDHTPNMIQVYWKSREGPGWHGEGLDGNKIINAIVKFNTSLFDRGVYLQELTQVLGARTDDERANGYGPSESVFYGGSEGGYPSVEYKPHDLDAGNILYEREIGTLPPDDSSK